MFLFSMLFFSKPVRTILTSAESMIMLTSEDIGAAVQTAAVDKIENQIVAKTKSPQKKRPTQTVEESVQPTQLSEAQPALLATGTVMDQAAKVQPIPEASSTTDGRLESGFVTESGSGKPGSSAGLRPIDRYLSGLRQMIAQKKVYPSLSRRLGEEGRVLITFHLLRDGRIQDVQIKQASAHARLNEAALQSVSKMTSYKPIPDVIAESALTVEVPIEFSL